MSKVTNHQASRRRRKRTLLRARGYFGNKSRLYRYAQEAVDRSGQFAYRDRRKKKTTWRQLWIVRLNAACRPQGINYSRFINGLKKARVGMDRKALSQLALEDPAAFQALILRAKAALKT